MDHTLWGRHRVYDHLEQLRMEVDADPSNQRAMRGLIDALQHGRTSFERTSAAAQLGWLGPKAAPAVEALIAAVQGPDLYVAPQAAMALGNIGPHAEAAVPVLIRMMRERPNSDTGWLSAEAVGKIAGPDDTAAWAALKQATESSNRILSASAKRGIQAMSDRGQGARTAPAAVR